MFNPPTPILFSLFFRFLLVKHAVQLHVPDNGTGLPNQARFESKPIASLFIFIFFFNPPKKMITALQLNKKDPETGKMYVALYPVTRRAPKTSRAPKRDRYETLVYWTAYLNRHSVRGT